MGRSALPTEPARLVGKPHVEREDAQNKDRARQIADHYGPVQRFAELFAQDEQCLDGFQRGPHQHDLRVVGGKGGGAAHGDRNIGLCERKAVVNAVAHKAHHLAPGLKVSDNAGFFLRAHAGERAVHLQPLGKVFGGRARVARQNEDGDPPVLQRFDEAVGAEPQLCLQVKGARNAPPIAT